MQPKRIEEIKAEIFAFPKTTEQKFKRIHPDEYDEMMSWIFPDTFTFKQKLYHYINNDYELQLGICPACGKRCGFMTITTGYHTYCSNKCSTSSKEVQEKMANACIEKYGARHQMLNENVKEKIKQTNIRKYGTEYGWQNELVKEKIKQTNIKRYGVENLMESETTKNKIKQTNLKRYGTEYASQNPVIKKKVAETNKERYGVEYGILNDDIRNKMTATMLDRYGVMYSGQSDELRNKAKRTNIAKYGTEHPTQSEDVKERVHATCIERFGVEWACMRPEARKHKTISKVNLAFAEQLSANGIEYEMEFPLGSYSYDFKVGNMLIEINPTITHNSFLNIFGGEPKPSDYHLLKSKTATSNGYRCIHIWDWDDWDKIVSILKPKQPLHARSLEIREVKEKDCNELLNTYHLQDSCRGQNIRLGLYKDNILVELMTFGKPRYNRNYEYELLRLCSHSDYMVVGGAERLFKHFIEHYSPQSIISYCDASKFDGGVYARLGFRKMKRSAPTKHWCNPNNSQHITDNLLRQRGFDQLFGTEYGKGTDNEELMLEHGFLPVYDCGQLSFIWKRN